MKTQVEFAGPIPVLRLEGRLDGYGSTVFDQCVSGLQQESSAVVVDCSQVEYLSSMGIRSLLKLEKNLAKRGGGIVFTGIRPFVAQVFASAGLQSLLERPVPSKKPSSWPEFPAAPVPIHCIKPTAPGSTRFPRHPAAPAPWRYGALSRSPV